jgi:hypothetical protein
VLRSYLCRGDRKGRLPAGYAVSLVVALHLAVSHEVAGARDLFVDNVAGNNENNGLLARNAAPGVGPLRSISAALRRVEPGDRIVIANTRQPYRECLTVQGARHSGSPRRPFVIEGNGAILDGSAAPDGRFAGHPVGITLYDVIHVLIRNLVVRGYRLDGVNAHDNAMECTLAGLRCEENGRSGFSIGGASRVTIVDCSAAANGDCQLRTEGWSTARVRDTRLVSAEGAPAWKRGGALQGPGGGRLYLDGQLQDGRQPKSPDRRGHDSRPRDPFADNDSPR